MRSCFRKIALTPFLKMISAEQNELMTRIGPGTPAGTLLRTTGSRWRWSTSCRDRPVKAVRLLGRIWFFSRRRASMACSSAIARIAARTSPTAGSRTAACAAPSTAGFSTPTAGASRRRPSPRAAGCASTSGREPIRSARRAASCSPTSATASAPAFPHFDCFVAPDDVHLRLQGLLGLQLAAGARGRHRSGARLVAAQVLRGRGSGRELRPAVPLHAGGRRHPDEQGAARARPAEIRVEAHRIWHATPHLTQDQRCKQTHMRVTNILFPQAFVIPMNPEMTISQWHVPVDDNGCYWYSIFTSFGAPVDKDTMRAQRLKTYPAPDYKPVFSRENPGGSAPTSSVPGPSPAWASTSTSTTNGPASRRAASRIAPGSTSAAPTRGSCSTGDSARRDPQEQAGEKPPMVLDARAAREITGPPAVDGIGPSDGLEEYWQDFDANRRRKSAWG